LTTFHVPENDATTTVAAPRAAGAAPVVVADGSAFGATFPKVLTITRESVVVSGGIARIVEALVCRLELTGRTGNTLSVGAAIEATIDAPLLVGDIASLRPTKLAMTEVHGAIQALEATAAGLGTASTHPAGDFQAAGSYQPLDPDLTAIAALSHARGQVIADTGAAWAALAPGADTQVLTLDSTTAVGFKWATPAPGGTPGGTSGAVQFNNGGAFGGFGSWDGSTLAAPRVAAPATADTYASERFGAATAPNVSGILNLIAGTHAAADLTTGLGNTIVGGLAGAGLTIGSRNVIFGSQTTVPAAMSGSVLLGSLQAISGSGSNVIGLGSSQTIAHNNVTVLGAGAITTQDGQFITGQNIAAWTMTGPTTLQERPVAEFRRSLPATADATFQGQLDVGVYDWAGFRTGLTLYADGTQMVVTLSGVVAIGTATGLAKLTSGVVSTATAGTDYLTPTVDRYDRPFGAASVSAGGSTTLDLGVHNDWIVTLNGTGTLAISNDTGNQPITLKIVQGGAGNFTLTWPGTVTWFTATFTQPTLAATAGKATYVVLRRTGAGTYDGFAVGASGT
jgi:hypothetical protein